jgi:hypothetical protein
MNFENNSRIQQITIQNFDIISLSIMTGMGSSKFFRRIIEKVSNK